MTIADLALDLQRIFTVSERNQRLDRHPSVIEALSQSERLRRSMSMLSEEEACVLKQFLALEQWPSSFPPLGEHDLSSFLKPLIEVDTFYQQLGGLVGYQAEIERALAGKKEEIEEALFHAPPFVLLTEENKEVKIWTEEGIGALPFLAQLIPLGGSADRLHLVDEKTGEDLPAARLMFNGKTLLEGLIRDLEALEHLYFQKHGKKIVVPIGLMTSPDKQNHKKVVEICEEASWFGRGKENFFLFSQPLVPTVDEKGKWCWMGPYRPFFKPGGHGALWKLAEDKGVLSWFQALGKKFLLVRQINNPVAGLDYGLLAFLGYGVKHDMHFGFASCPRTVHAAEGVNVLIEKKGTHLVLTNIEYCDFAKHGIEDQPLTPEEPYSQFSSNTNILFATLDAIRFAVKKSPYPGLLVNMKKGKCGEDHLHGRLESTMQNLADVFVEEKGDRLATEKTFVTYNHRHKTIATAKKAYLPGGPFQETPELCFYELMRAMRLLLEGDCKVALPPPCSLEEMLTQGPPFVFTYHPALGPLYASIREKIQRGFLSQGSFCSLEISRLLLHDFSLQGSLEILSLGLAGTCVLRNVKIENRGVDWTASAPFWKNTPAHQERLKIVIEGNGEFFAEGVFLQGEQLFVVPKGTRVRVTQSGIIHEPL